MLLFNRENSSKEAHAVMLPFFFIPISTMQSALMMALRYLTRCNTQLCFAGNCLQRLDLSDNPMTGDVAQALAVMLQQQPHLRALNLNDTSLEDAGISIIAQALANSGICLDSLTPKPSRSHGQV